MNREEILRRAKALPGHIGLYIDTLDGGETIAYQADEPIEAASVIKLTVMAEAFRQREAGTFDFAAPVTIRPEDKLPSCGALTYLARRPDRPVGRPGDADDHPQRQHGDEPADRPAGEPRRSTG